MRVSGVVNGAGGYGIRPYELRVTGIDPGTSANGRLAGEQCSPPAITIIVAYLQSKSKTAKRSDPAVTR